jgi:hypothetical protein
MAKGVGGIRVLLRPAAISIEGHAYMARGLGEVEIFDDPPLIEGIEE